MNKDVFLSTGLLLASYGAVLWLTSDDHQTVRGIDTASAATVQHEITSRPKVLAEPAERTIDLGADADVARDAIEPLDDEAENATAGSPGIADASIVDAPSSSPPPLQSARALSDVIQRSADRASRITAVNSLLLMGRKSLVDPDVIAALKDAAKVSDNAVSALATSALAEVERETH